MNSWEEARVLAHAIGADRPTRVLTVPLGRAAGLTLARDLVAEHALPRFDNSAMDGWAVAGDGPWRESEPVLAGSAPPIVPLNPGEARPVATGAPVPPGTLTVVRTEDGIRDPVADGHLIDTLARPDAGRDIRRRGEEFAQGELLLTAGTVLTPPALGLIAAAGAGEVDVSSPPRATYIAIGDELTCLEPGPGQVTDSLTPLMPALLASLGARSASMVRALDRPEDVVATIRRSRTELLITSGGTAHGPTDPVREALAELRARVLLDGVDVRPGRSVLLAELPDGKVLLALPGNPLAAVVGLLIVGWSLVQGRLGRELSELPVCAPPDGAEDGVPRAIACAVVDGVLTPVAYQRSGMLRGIATASHLAMVHGGEARVLRLPWSC